MKKLLSYILLLDKYIDEYSKKHMITLRLFHIFELRIRLIRAGE